MEASISSVVGRERAPSPPSGAELQRLFERQRAHAPTVRATSAAERGQKLRRLVDALLARRTELRTAMAEDFNKPPQEVDLTELLPVISEARLAARRLRRWMRPRRVSTSPLVLPGYTSEIRYEPKGVVAIISPWNFPVNLSLGPLVGALAAGNCVILKPSEYTPRTSRFIRELLASLFPPEEVAVVEGEAPVAEALVRLPLDHIFFTGNPVVGKKVMKAAADNLTGLTLELGGKSPAIVDGRGDIELAAEKIAWGKFVNAGQTCIAPDYVLVEAKAHDALVAGISRKLQDLYGSEGQRKQNPDLARIVTVRHAERLSSLLKSAIADGARVAVGGQVEVADRYVAPTVVTNVSPSSALMQEEIFGPILPVLPYGSLDEAIAFVNARPKPLSLYVFSRDRRFTERVLDETTAGGGCVNDTLLHYMNPSLPFGGLGNSGIGRGHGHESFLAFSNERAVLRRRVGVPIINALYPPFGRKFSRRLVDVLLRYLA